jgi:hypothetical protein
MGVSCLEFEYQTWRDRKKEGMAEQHLHSNSIERQRSDKKQSSHSFDCRSIHRNWHNLMLCKGQSVRVVSNINLVDSNQGHQSHTYCMLLVLPVSQLSLYLVSAKKQSCCVATGLALVFSPALTPWRHTFVVPKLGPRRNSDHCPHGTQQMHELTQTHYTQPKSSARWQMRSELRPRAEETIQIDAERLFAAHSSRARWAASAGRVGAVWVRNLGSWLETCWMSWSLSQSALWIAWNIERTD